MALPPLNALKAFEAACRLRSFKLAAQELHVSPGAVSRHVKLLEEHFGVCLFERLAQGIRPTGYAERLAPKVTDAFGLISAAVAETIPVRAARLRICAPPTFANRLLIPRLDTFTRNGRQVDVSVGILLTDVRALPVSTIDCGICTTHNPTWPQHLRVALIKHEELTPVCAPGYLAANTPLRDPADVLSLKCLHVENCPEDWPNWCRLNGIPPQNAPRSGPGFETGELAIRAAAEGLGIIMMDRHLIRRELADGRLVDLFPQSRPVDNGYYFFCETARWDDPLIGSFRQWLQDEFSGK